MNSARMEKAEMDIFRSSLINVLILLPVLAPRDIAACKSPQYLELGKNATVECTFEEGFYVVAWYNTKDVSSGISLIRLRNGITSGDGASSGEFDVSPNGSLIIQNVTLKHDHNFTVLKFDSEGDRPVSECVEVIVTVKPLTTFPMVNLNWQRNNTYFTLLNPNSEVTCFINHSRPAITLHWAKRTVHRDMRVSSSITVKEDGTGFTTRVTTSEIFRKSSYLSLMICKAESLPGMLSHDETFVFVEKSDIDLSTVHPVTMFVARGTRIELRCSNTDVHLIVWKMAVNREGDFRLLSFAALFNESISTTLSDNYEIQTDGSLVVPRIETRHEGLYGCIYENSDVHHMKVFQIAVYVHAYPVVDGCRQHHYCALKQKSQGNLTCSVTGVRPQVELEWKTVYEKDSSSISFTDHSVIDKIDGDIYYIGLTSRYHLHDIQKDKLTLECRIKGTNIDALRSSVVIDLLITDFQSTNEAAVGVKISPLWIVVVVVVFSALFVAVYRIVKGQKRRELHDFQERLLATVSNHSREFYNQSDHDKRQSQVGYYTPSEQAVQMTLQTTNLEEMKNVFISGLNAKYRDLCDKIQPIPFIRDRFYRVDRIFVEGGIEYMVTKENTKVSPTWEKLPTYHKILNDDRVKSTRRIIEGEAGYGKSTLALRFAYDWCNAISDSPLKSIEIFILLRLRQLRGVKSIHAAIKQFLLPKDSQLSENDVKAILYNSVSVLVILEGLDEYPHKNGNTDYDIISIIKGEMFQQFDVILTTRSSYLPDEIPALTKRLKLTGFDEKTRDQYIRKAVVGDDAVATKNIEKLLKENPILVELCQVPLFFVMYAHMSHESEQVQKVETVTSYFKYMIACFHNHMKNKRNQEHNMTYNPFLKEHMPLNKLAFEGLSGKTEQINWKRKDMCERVGQEFYDHYVRIGILVEEEILDKEQGQYKTEVRFYHKLLCEWYAAHHLSEYASKDGMTVNPLKKTIPKQKYADYLKYLDPLNAPYVYRFACGLNATACGNIITYLNSTKSTKKFAILCLLEKNDKILDTLQDINDLCSTTVTINKYDSLLLQRTTKQLLEIAASYQISISKMYLGNCCTTDDLCCKNYLQLISNLSIPAFTTLEELAIEEIGKEITVEEMKMFLQYSLMCSSLKKVEYFACLMPRSVQFESFSCLVSRKLQVVWENYHLNLSSGLWEFCADGDQNDVMTDEVYQQKTKFVEGLRQQRVELRTT